MRHTPHRRRAGGSRRNLGRPGYSAVRLAEHALDMLTIIQAHPRFRYVPSKAMRRDVFPEPVGPTIKFTLPRLKMTSSSILRVKLRRFGPGVTEPSFSFDQVKAAWRIPMTSFSVVRGGTTSSADAASFSLNSSSSSVCKMY